MRSGRETTPNLQRRMEQPFYRAGVADCQPSGGDQVAYLVRGQLTEGLAGPAAFVTFRPNRTRSIKGREQSGRAGKWCRRWSLARAGNYSKRIDSTIC